MKLNIAASVLASLLPACVALKVREYTATYDENEPNSGFYGVNITGSYNALHYDKWYAGPFDQAAGQCVSVCAQSFPVEAAFDGGKGKKATISASYANSTVKYFDLKDFYWGCNIHYNDTTEGHVFAFTGPGNCTLNVEARLDSTSATVARQTFQYRPNIQYASNTGAPYASMTHAVFNADFHKPGIRYVVFSATGPKQDILLGVAWNASAPQVLVDNLHYLTYSTR